MSVDALAHGEVRLAEAPVSDVVVWDEAADQFLAAAAAAVRAAQEVRDGDADAALALVSSLHTHVGLAARALEGTAPATPRVVASLCAACSHPYHGDEGRCLVDGGACACYADVPPPVVQAVALRAAVWLVEMFGDRVPVGVESVPGAFLAGEPLRVRTGFGSGMDAEAFAGIRVLAESIGCTPVDRYARTTTDDGSVKLTITFEVDGVQVTAVAILHDPDVVAEARAWIAEAQGRSGGAR